MTTSIAGLRVTQIRPSGGGVGTYATAMSKVYGGLGALVTPLVSDVYGGRRMDGLELLERVPASAELLHVELGAGHSTAFWATVEAQRRGLPLLVTVHDRGLVHNAYPLDYALAQRLGLPGALAQRASMEVTGRLLVPRLSRSLHPHRASLMSGDPEATFWLPHPRMTDPAMAREPGAARSSVRRFGFIGSWSPSKGLSELIEAWTSVSRHGLGLLVTGASGDRYGRRLASRLRGRQNVTVRGVLPDDDAVDQALLGLDVLVLPYRRSWSGSASGVAQRAAELGVPMIASDLPALRAQLGDDGASWIVPGSIASLLARIRLFSEDATSALASADAAGRRVCLAEAALPQSLIKAALSGGSALEGAGR